MPSRPKKKTGTKKGGRSSPWFIGIVCGLIGAFLVGVILFYFFGHREQQIYRAIFMTSINNADRLMEKDMPEDALAIYNDIASKRSAKKKPEFYAHIKNSEGVCHYKVALLKDMKSTSSKPSGPLKRP